MVLLALSAAAPGGCGPDEAIYATDARKANGLVVILPGIEGESELNHDIRDGLMEGGVDYALVIRPWGVPVPGVGMLVNQTNFLGNRLAGAGVARMIAEYQNSHPGRPVYVVGHSGGGGVAVFTAEALADMEGDHRVDGLVLLSASISGDYDLGKALGRSRNGLVNFYNAEDTALLGVGTTVLGNVDGGRAPSAGRVGFQRDFPHLYQVEADPGLGGDDPHASTTRSPFVAAYVARWVRAQSWPAGRAPASARPR
jgi:pimeloyl-ACP methyl ester carboxylesterase